jgi:hypothetical protein
MRKRIMIGSVILVSALLLFSPTHSPATTITFNLNYEFSGGQSPNATQPPSWLTATFSDELHTGFVTLTMAATNLSGNEFVGDWLFNLRTGLNPSDLAFTPVSGILASNVLHDPGKNEYKADGDGKFDIQFVFPASNRYPELRLSIGDISVYNIAGIAGLTVDDFNLVSETGGGQGIYHSAAHVQGILIPDSIKTGSGWIADGTPTAPVPEPATMFLLGSGLIGLAGFARRKFRK